MCTTIQLISISTFIVTINMEQTVCAGRGVPSLTCGGSLVPQGGGSKRLSSAADKNSSKMSRIFTFCRVTVWEKSKVTGTLLERHGNVTGTFLER
jgi:hypothetical protein